MTRIGIFGWGIVAPRSRNMAAFAENLERSESWLSPFEGFGPSNFLVGQPDFDFDEYRGWIEERFSPNRYHRIVSKFGFPTRYTIGCFIQALADNPGLEQELSRLGTGCHVYIATGVGDIPTQYEESVRYYRKSRRWNRFWSQPERNGALREWRQDPKAAAGPVEPPPDPSEAPEEEREDAENAWWSFWTARSPELASYLAELREIEAMPVVGEVEAGKLSVLRGKSRRIRQLQEKWEAPDPPWQAVSANLLWNIHNMPASQVSILGKITGPALSTVAACSSFGVTLKLAVDAIRSRQAVAVVIGATDPPPHPLTVAAMYDARILSADGGVSKPLTELRGTHVSGGGVVWIVADYEHMVKRGFRPVGLEPLAVGVTSDADHIITPTKPGPTAAIESALRDAGTGADEFVTWDMHATATPGDFSELETLRDLFPESLMVTARKGTFGHGMSAAGGWELTAQYLGIERRRIFPTPLRTEELHPEIEALHRKFAFDHAEGYDGGVVGKLSMGVGGINACVVSRPWPEKA